MSIVARLRAPQENEMILAEPALEYVPELLAGNRRRLGQGLRPLLGRDMQELRQQARQDALLAAQAYLRRTGEPLPPGNAASLLLAGHQPELFHPGVWIKNFALNGLARAAAATPINLIVDNDTVKEPTLSLPKLRVPLPPIAEFQPHLLAIAYDRGSAEAVWEERTVQDEAFFRSFPERVPLDWGFTPLLSRFWQDVCFQAQHTNLLGERFAAARRQWERRWDCHNLEVPVSALCATEPYGWFAGHLLSELPRFHALYNETVRAYRRRYRMRSRHHPVPDLAAEGDWLEAPFWAWRRGQTKRGRLLARPTARGVELRVGQERWPTLPCGSGSAASTFVHAWHGLHQDGYKIRSRALTNTLYARVFLADLFLHGLGGGKYDELTDRLIQEFYGLDSPGYLVLSATLRLPLPRYPVTAEECRRCWRRLRDLRCNPQRHLEELTTIPAAAHELARRKQQRIAAPGTTRRQRRQNFHELRRLTEQLRGYLGPQEQAAYRDWNHCRQQMQANQTLQRRDYAFCLYPEELLRPFLTQLL